MCCMWLPSACGQHSNFPVCTSRVNSKWTEIYSPVHTLLDRDSMQGATCSLGARTIHTHSHTHERVIAYQWILIEAGCRESNRRQFLATWWLWIQYSSLLSAPLLVFSKRLLSWTDWMPHRIYISPLVVVVIIMAAKEEVRQSNINGWSVRTSTRLSPPADAVRVNGGLTCVVRPNYSVHLNPTW